MGDPFCQEAVSTEVVLPSVPRARASLVSMSEAVVEEKMSEAVKEEVMSEAVVRDHSDEHAWLDSVLANLAELDQSACLRELNNEERSTQDRHGIADRAGGKRGVEP